MVLADEYFEINGEILVTAEHPFLVGDVWKNAGDLVPGDALRANGGEVVVVRAVDRISMGVRAYNLSVDTPHTFYAQGVLVHNKSPDPTDP